MLAMITAAIRHAHGDHPGLATIAKIQRNLRSQSNTFRDSAIGERESALGIDVYLRNNPQAPDYAAQYANYNQAILNEQHYQAISDTSAEQRTIIAKLVSEKPDITDASAALIRTFNPQYQGESLGHYAKRLAGSNDFHDADNMNYKNIAKVAEVTHEEVLTAIDTGNGTLEFGY